MKKIFLLVLVICVCKFSIAQVPAISDQWNFQEVVSKRMSADTTHKDTVIIKLATIRQYQNKWKTNQVINVRIEELRYFANGKCWSIINAKALEISSNAIDLSDRRKKRNKAVFSREMSTDTLVCFSTNKSDSLRLDTLRKVVNSIANQELTDENSKIAEQLGLVSSGDKLPVIESKRDFGGALSFTPQIAFARIHVDEASFSDASKLDKRVQQTRPIYGYSYAFSVHKWVNNSNRFYGTLAYEQMGWENKQSAVDWSTGYSRDTTTIVYKFGFWQAGVGYAYVGKTAPVKFVLDLGMSVLWKRNDHFFQNEGQVSNQPGFKTTLLMASIGAGINVSLSKRLSFECLPNVSIPFTPVHSAHLRTSLYNVGFTGRLLFDFYKR